MGKKSHQANHKELTEQEDKHKPKTKAQKKLEHHEHKMKKNAKAEMAKNCTNA